MLQVLLNSVTAEIDFGARKFPIIRVGSTGRCNTIWYKAAFKGGVYEAGKRFGLSAEQKIEVWRRWKAGQTFQESVASTH